VKHSFAELLGLVVIRLPSFRPGKHRLRSAAMWWEDAVVYQVYPRSFQDSDGDGVGDLPGIAARLDHVKALGVDALWLSPVYPSPLADFGYDITDHTAIDPVYGTLDDFDALVAATHGRGLRLLMDLVPCHTSIEHPWFREHPDWYIWADGDEPPNNWIATFGGPAWTRDERSGRWYLHSFYPEQPDLDWRNPEVVAAMQDVVRFWLDRGVDGFRIDAIDRLLKDPGLRDDPPAGAPPPLPQLDEYATLEHLYSVNAADIETALGALREAAGDAFLVGEVYLPTASLAPYLRHLDAAFCFELLHAPPDAEALRAVLEAAAELDGSAWVLSNHDFGRLATHFGHERERIAMLLLLTLPGVAFLYQGDEIAMGEGPGHDPPLDRAGRDRTRHPMQWEGTPLGGFTAGEPWLPVVDAPARNVADQCGDPASTLALARGAIAVRHELAGGVRFLDAAGGVLAFQRGSGHVVALNLAGEPRPAPPAGELRLTTDGASSGAAPQELGPHEGFVALSAH
jgi:alpha-glucosidase